MAEKTMLQNFKGMFTKRKNEAKGKNISATKVISLQRKYVETACDSQQKVNTPYEEIVMQLSDSRVEVSFAAAFYLIEIACKYPQEADKTIEILQDYLKKSKLDEPLLQILRQKIETIKVC